MSPTPLYIYSMTTDVPGQKRNGQVLENNGALVCDCPARQRKSIVWCEHLEHVVREGLDATLLSTDRTIECVTVPMTPTQNFFIEVVLGDIDGGFRTVEIIGGATFLAGKNLSNAPLKGEAVRLAPIGAGEGRLVIRSMAMEWLHAARNHVGPCKSSRHAIHGSDKYLPIDVFSLLTRGLCSSCAAAAITGAKSHVPEP